MTTAARQFATDYYQELGVSRSATEAELKSAFRKKSKTVHPDAGGDEVSWKRLNQAYSVLSDADQRKRYDMFGEAGVQNAAGQSENDSGGGGFSQEVRTRPPPYNRGRRLSPTSTLPPYSQTEPIPRFSLGGH